MWDDDEGFEEGEESLGAAERGCGKRKKGGIYAEVPLKDKEGYPFESFLICPPIPIHDPKAYGITPLGVKLIERDGVYHVFDWIGSKHYPNVWDFIAEGKAHGISRRLPKNLDFSKVTKESRIIFIHSRAHMTNTLEFAAAAMTRNQSVDGVSFCPKDTDHPSGEMCLNMCQHDIVGGVEDISSDLNNPDVVHRTIGSVDYAGWRSILPDADKGYVPAVFLSLPLSRLAVIAGNGADKAMEAAQKASVPVKMWDE